MSYLVLHMDKFKRDAIRGIESHNKRKRHSHTNPDIDYERSTANYDLVANAPHDYATAVQDRIDHLLLTKAVRKDAVQLCGLVVSSDKEFFQRLTACETRRFFEESMKFLTSFVGKENVISAMVHMDETTPHMHFFHVPVTADGRLSAKAIYTRQTLKKLQTELPQYLQQCGFSIERGVEQTPGSAKKHLDTREFKQQREALTRLQDVFLAQEERNAVLQAKAKELLREQREYEEHLANLHRQAKEVEVMLSDTLILPQANIFNYKNVLEKAERLIATQKQSLCMQKYLEEENARLHKEIADLVKKYETMLHSHNTEKAKLKNELGWLRLEMDSKQQMRSDQDDFLLLPDVASRLEVFIQQRKAERMHQIALEAEAKRQEEAKLLRRNREIEAQRLQELDRRREEIQNQEWDFASVQSEERPQSVEYPQRSSFRLR